MKAAGEVYLVHGCPNIVGPEVFLSNRRWTTLSTMDLTSDTLQDQLLARVFILQTK